MARSYSWNHQTMSQDNLSMAVNLSLLTVTPIKMILPYACQSYWVLCSTIVKTLVYFANLHERLQHFNKFYNINTTNAMCIIIKPQTSLTPMS